MAARPVPYSLAALSLVFGFAVAAPALAQNYIGSGNVQVNMQALDQLGGARMASPATIQLPLIGSTGKAPKQAVAPLAAQPSDALLGETGQAAGAIKLRRPGSSARKASAPAAPKAAAKAAPAAAPTPPAVASAPAAAPTTPAAPAPSVPAPTTPAPAASAPVTPAPATPAPTPAPQAGAPTQVVPAAPTATPAPSVAAAPPAPVPAPAPQAAAPAPAPQAAAPAAPQAAPQPAPAPQVAAAPTPPRPVPAPGPAGLVTLAFPGGQGELPAADLAALDALARQYANGEDRLQIRAYAASTVSDGGSGARRLSLTRALAVRQYLIDKGIRSTRIDVRALGAPTDGSAADRVEVALVGR
jgi:outer membrane protein OmpA-like peptidoglycan-associated protein